MSEAAAIAARAAPWMISVAAVLCFVLPLPLVLRADALRSTMYAVPLQALDLNARRWGAAGDEPARYGLPRGGMFVYVTVPS